eukprot:CAMPEP_0171126302 /NCGR_PEP_ID=MMETSP0766_2-20121228/113051_1 /TAXON_ID=439317 /ORGANISM="Gambierdiscus australes, Strain CAWD 149" /LENGTH=49 /DNA_ID= /DNA_START= /DNA_END= /DNA_ORIENTATION=
MITTAPRELRCVRAEDRVLQEVACRRSPGGLNGQQRRQNEAKRPKATQL